MDIDAGAAAVGMRAGGEGRAVEADAAVQIERGRGGAKPLDIEPLVGLQRQRGGSAGGVDVAALNHVLIRAHHQVLVGAQAGDGAGDQHAVAAGVLHQIVARADGGNVGEVASLVENGVTRLVIYRGRVAVVVGLPHLRSRGQVHVAGGRDRTAEQHLAAGDQVQRAVGAADAGRDAGEFDAGADRRTGIDRDNVGRGDVQRGVRAQALDVRAFDHDDRAGGVEVEPGTSAADGDLAAQLCAVRECDGDPAGIRRGGDQAGQIDREAGSAIR